MGLQICFGGRADRLAEGSGGWDEGKGGSKDDSQGSGLSTWR